MKKLIALAAIFAASVPATSAFAQNIDLTIGGGIASGDYGSSRSTTMTNGTAGLRWSSGSTSISATLPYVVIESPGVAFSGFDGTPLIMLADGGGRKRISQGVADPTFSLSSAKNISNLSIRGTARVKIPVQKLNGISTGKMDWSSSVEISTTTGNISPFALISYRSYGDPSSWTIKDGFAGAIGASAPIGKGSAAISYNLAQSTSEFIEDGHEIIALYERPISQKMRLSGYASVGLSDGAPGVGAGIRLALKV